MDSTYIQSAYSTGDLDLVVDTATLGVIIRFILDMTLETLTMYGFRLHVRVVILRFLGLRLVIYCRRNLAEPFPGVPHLKYDIKDFPVNLPRCAAQDIQASIHEFEIAQRRSMMKVALLFLTVLETHDRGWICTSADLRCMTRRILTLVVDVPALVRSEPWLGLDKHWKMARMKCFAQRILGESVGNHRIQADDTQFLTTNVFVCVVKRGLPLLPVCMISPLTTQERQRLHLQFLTGPLVECRPFDSGDVHQAIDEDTSHPHAQQLRPLRCPFFVILNILCRCDSSCVQVPVA